MTAILIVWRYIGNPRQSRNNPAKFHPDPIWNDRAQGFFEDGHPSKNKKKKTNKMSSDMESGYGAKLCI